MKRFTLIGGLILMGCLVLSGMAPLVLADSNATNQTASSSISASDTRALFAANQLVYDESPNANQSLGHIDPVLHRRIEAVKKIYDKNHLNYGYKISPYLIWEMLQFNQRLKQYPNHPWLNMISLQSTHGQSLKAVANQYLKHNYLGPTNKYGMVILMVQGTAYNKLYFDFYDSGLGSKGLKYLNDTSKITVFNDVGANLNSNRSLDIDNGAETVFQTLPNMFNDQIQLQKSLSSNVNSNSVSTSGNVSNPTLNLVKGLPTPTVTQIKAGQAIYQKNGLDKMGKISPELMGQIYVLNQKWAQLPHHPWVVVVSANSSHGLLAQDAAKPYLKHNPFGATNKYGMVLISVNNDNNNNFGVQVNENGLGLTGLRNFSESQAYTLLANHADTLKSSDNDEFNFGLTTVLAFYNHRVVKDIKYEKPSWLVYQYNVNGPQSVLLMVGLLFGFLGVFFPVWIRLYQKLNHYLFPDGVNYTGDDDILFARPHQLGNHQATHVIDDKASRGGGFVGGGGFSGGGGGFGGGGASI